MKKAELNNMFLNLEVKEFFIMNINDKVNKVVSVYNFKPNNKKKIDSTEEKVVHIVTGYTSVGKKIVYIKDIIIYNIPST